MPSPLSLRVLVAKSIDYAGMFPPCSLDLDPAIENQAKYVRSSDAWMLSTFVLPVDKFEPARRLLARFDRTHPFRVSVLGPKTPDAAGFLRALHNIGTAMNSFAANEAVAIDQLEIFLPDQVNIDALSEAGSALGAVPAFFEASVDRAEGVIDLLAKLNAKSEGRFGFKLRTGGVTADAFPTSAQIAQVLISAAREQVPIKFTAGLHHPIRQFRQEVNTKMHGFLNVLGAAILTSIHKWDDKQAAAMLEDEDVNSFSFGEDRLSWREWSADVKSIEDERKRVFSFGSCSFDEPREDLRALGLF